MFGKVNEATKARFLSRAKALVMPYLDDLSAFTCQTILEAFQYGTPVIAFNRGAVPEFVEDGVNGLICDDIDDLPAAVRQLDNISPDKCQETAEKYSLESAIGKYEKLLEEPEW
jgi:glycosyltransferase involved in cell wall biosynthesis